MSPTKKGVLLASVSVILASNVMLFANDRAPIPTTAHDQPPQMVITPQGSGGRQGYAPGDIVGDELVIPNAPILAPSQIIELSAVGMGVAPENTISPAQALALAKRAAIIDAYRQLGEKMYGIRVNAKETVKDMVLKNSTIKTKVLALIKNAEIVETTYKDGLCQVQMELKLDGKRWYGLLTGRQYE